MRHLIALSLGLCTALLAPAGSAEAADARMSADECAVWDRELSFAQSVADHDAARFATHVEADAAFSAESPQPTRGRETVAARWAPLIEGKALRLSWYPARVTIAGAPDIAVSSGPALFEDLRPDAQPRYRIGGFHSVWHRGADGIWRVLFDDGVEPQPADDAQVAAFLAARRETCPRQ